METNTDDHALLRKFVEEKDQASFSLLVHRHLGLVYRSALRQTNGCQHLAADIAQEVFVRLVAKAPKLTGHPALVGWLHATTRLVALETRRSQQRLQKREREALSMQHFEQDAHNSAADWSLLAPVLDEALTDLNEGDRHVLLLRYFSDLPHQEIGTRLGIAENTARMRVQRALEKLESALAKRGVVASSAALAAALPLEARSASVPQELVSTISHAALTSAPAPTLGLLGGLASSPVSLIGGALVALLTAGGIALYANLSTNDTQTASASATPPASSEPALQQTLPQNTTAAPSVSSQQSTAAANASPSSAPSSEAWDPVKEGRAFLERHPKLKSAVIERSDAVIRFKYSRLFSAQKWDNDKITRFLEALRFNSGTGVTNASGKPIYLSGTAAGEYEKLSERLGELLDKEGSRLFNEVSANGLARDTTLNLASRLHFTDTPLTPDQAEQLQRALIRATSCDPATNKRSLNWDSALLETKGILSEPQRAVLSRLREKSGIATQISAPSSTSSATAGTKGNASLNDADTNWDQRMNAKLSEFYQERNTSAFQITDRETRKIDTVTNYALLFRRLNLSQDQIERFANIETEFQMTLTDITSAAAACGIKGTNPVLGKFYTQAQSQHSEALNLLLGPAGIAQYDNYMKTDFVRKAVSGSAAAALLTGIPFTQEQSEKIVEIIAQASGAFRKGFRVDTTEIDWQAVETKIAAVLSPEQFLFWQTCETSAGGGIFNLRWNAELMRARKSE